MSLDVSKAFDKAHRPILYASLSNGVDPTIIAVLQSLQQNAKYWFQVGSLTGFSETSDGVTQGCKAAPFSIMQRLQLRSHECARSLLTTTGPTGSHWSSMSLKISVLKSYRKTAVLIPLEGRQVTPLLRDFTNRRESPTCVPQFMLAHVEYQSGLKTSTLDQ